MGDQRNPAVMLIHGMVSSWRDCAPYGKYLLYNFCQYTSALSLAGIRSLIPSGCFSELFFMRSGIIFQPEKSSLTIEKSNKIMHYGKAGKNEKE